MICPMSVDHLQTALALRAKLQAELEWLRVAAKSYPDDVYRRLVDHSASRLQWIMQDEFQLGRSRVQFQVDPKDATHIDVRILWVVRRADEALAAAWARVMQFPAMA